MKQRYPQFSCTLLGLIFLSLCFSWQAGAQVTVTSSGGTPTASYTTLKGAFDAINAGTHQAVINVSITANTTETATASLNANGNGSASYTSVTVKPGTGATPTVSGNIGSAPVVKLNGASNTTIDGSNNGTTSRDLTITNTSATSSNVLVIGSTGTTPITNTTVKNAILVNGTNTSTAVIVGDAAVPGNPGYFNNITLRNNDVRKAYIGTYFYAVVATGNGNNTLVTENNLNATGANAIRLVGIYAQGLTGLTISNNTIGNFESASAEFDRAIWLATATTNTTISGNTVTGLAYTGTSSYGPIGINVSSGVTNANITVTDNTVTNMTSSGTGTTMGMFIYSAMSNVSVKNNKVSNIKNTNTSGYGAAGILLAATINNAGIKIYNNFVWDVAAYGFNDYTSADNGNGIVVDGGGGYEINFNTVALNTNQTLTGGHRASCLLITSNVTAANSIDLRNNILANLQTIGNANSRLVISNLGPSNVFSAINRNDYYATSTNLSSTGTNASITNTIAQLQTSLGGNGNSVSIQPSFVATNDLHLNAYGNATLSDLGTPLASITTDIDAETRNGTTPDIGADEFVSCTAVNFTAQPVAAVICSGRDTSFQITTTNALQYQWQVNTGSGFTDITNNTIYGGATTNLLTLTNPPVGYSGYIYRCQAIAQTGCAFQSSNTATLTVNATPAAVITPASSTNLCTGGSVVLNATAGFSYQWQVGGSNIVPPATNSSYTASTAGSYTVVVTNTASGCNRTSAAVNVVVNPLINTTQSLVVCTSQMPYTWNAQTITTPGTAVATYTTPSLITGCDSTTTLNLSVNATVTATQNISICSGQLPYTWNGHVVASGGPAAATHSSVGSGGCDSVTTLNLTVIQPVTVPASITICHTQLPYTWNGNVVTGGGTAVATYTTPSLVTGCDSISSLNLTVNPGPVPISTPPVQAICSGTATSIALTSATTGTTFAWTVAQTGATGATAASGASIAQTLTASGSTPGRVIYTVTATANSCPGTPVNDTVTVNPKPVAVASPTSQTICSGATTAINLSSAVSGATFSWTVTQTGVTGATAGNGSSIAQALTATGTTNGTATYTITPTASGCPGTAITVVITVTPIPAVPGTITGADAPCAGSTQTYSVASVTGASGYIWALPPGWTGTSTTNSISVTVGTTAGNITVKSSNTCGSSATSSKEVIVTPIVTPAIAVSNNAPTPLCSGTPVTFTAAGLNGGTAPAYQWKVNSTNNGNNNSAFTYVPTDGDTVSCIMTSNAACPSSSQVTSNKTVMHVTPSVTPSLNIYVPENHICSGMPVTFLATPVNEGTAPVYQWKLNNVNTGTNSVNFTYQPANGDVVTCAMTSNAVCANPATIISNPVPMTIVQITHPTLAITANPGNALLNGESVTFTVQIQQGGTNPQIAWYRNGSPVPGQSGTSWTAVAGTDITNGNKIRARLHSTAHCAQPDSAWSNEIRMAIGVNSINDPSRPENFKLYPNPTSNTVHIEGLMTGDELSVYDALGHRVLHRKVQQNGVQTVDMADFAQGMYWIRFADTKGRHWQVNVTKQ